jgi:uncharacterized protein YxjI
MFIMSLESISRHYEVQEKPLASDSKFIILNDQGDCVFKVKSTIPSLGDQLSLYDAYGNELYKIRQQLILFLFNFNIYEKDDSEVASVQRRGMPWNYKLDVTSHVFGDYRMDWSSGFVNQEFTLTKDNKTVAEIKRNWISLTNNYSVAIADDVTDKEVAFVLALVITLWCAHRFRGQMPYVNS